MKLQTNNIEAISGPNQFSPARFIQFRYFEKYHVVSHSAVQCIIVLCTMVIDFLSCLSNTTFSYSSVSVAILYYINYEILHKLHNTV